MTEPEYPPQPADADDGHVLSEENWAEVERLQKEIAANLEGDG